MLTKVVDSDIMIMSPPTGYNLVWSDEFTGTTIDTTKWNVYDCHPRFTPSCAKPDNVIIDGNSNLHLRTLNNNVNIVCPACGVGWGASNYPWTGAVITTKNKFSFTYGFLEMRAKMPKQQGQSGGMWMTRADLLTPYREIDCPEWRGLDKNFLTNRNNRFFFTNLWTITTGTCPAGTATSIANRCANGKNFSADFDPSTDYHLYQLEWASTYMRFYIDGTFKGSVTSGIPTQAFEIILSWDTGAFDVADNTTVSPSDMIVDYVRVYQLNACLTPDMNMVVI